MNIVLVILVVVVVLSVISIYSSVTKKMKNDELNNNMSTSTSRIEFNEEEKEVETLGRGGLFRCLIGILLVCLIGYGLFNLCFEVDPYDREMHTTLSVEKIKKPMVSSKVVYSDGTESLESYKILCQGVNNDGHFVVVEKTFEDGTSKVDTLYRQTVDTNWETID
jgi:hypothetical protein